MEEDDNALRRAKLSARRSLLSSAKQARLEKRLRDLEQGTSVATTLHQHQGTVGSSPLLVPMQRGDPRRRPLFFVHPVIGHVLCYAGLAHHLEPDQPFYGLQAQGLDGEQPPHTQVQVMARQYIELLRTVQPKGPYLLGGWSLGGVVAFEMAQQLLAQGQPIELLALIDSRAPTGVSGPEPDETLLLAGFMLNLGLPLDRIMSGASRLERLGSEERLAFVLEQAKQADVLSPDMEPVQMYHLYGVFKSNVAAMRRYVPRAYPGPILLLRASEQPAEKQADKDLGWGALASGELTVQLVPGSHYTMIREPHVGILAGHLQRYLTAVAAREKWVDWRERE